MLLIFVLCSECPVVLSYTSLIPTKAVMTRVDSMDGIATGPSYLTWKLNTHKIPPCPLQKTWVIMIRPWIFPQVLPRDFSQIMSCSKLPFAREEHQNYQEIPQSWWIAQWEQCLHHSAKSNCQVPPQNVRPSKMLYNYI